MAQLPEDLQALAKWFTITSLRGSFIFHCQKCTAAWKIRKNTQGSLSGGNGLYLLNHAYSHYPDDRG